MAQPDARTTDLDQLTEKLAKLWFAISNPKADPETPCVSPVASDFIGPAGIHLFKATAIRPAWEFYLAKARSFAERLYADPEFRAISGESPVSEPREDATTDDLAP
jgi:hypothetical protein